MSKPKPAPVNPKPITHDPKLGQYQVVVSFRIPRLWSHPDNCRADLGYLLEDRIGYVSDLDIGIREIGAGGEKSQDEGRYDHPAALANLDDVQHVHATTDIQAKDKRL